MEARSPFRTRRRRMQTITIGSGGMISSARSDRISEAGQVGHAATTRPNATTAATNNGTAARENATRHDPSSSDSGSSADHACSGAACVGEGTISVSSLGPVPAVVNALSSEVIATATYCGGGGGTGGGAAGRLSQLPGVPAGTCIPSQLHGIIDRHARYAHCWSGVNGLGPAHGGIPGAPQIGSADAVGALANVTVAVASAMAAMTAVTTPRVRSSIEPDVPCPVWPATTHRAKLKRGV